MKRWLIIAAGLLLIVGGSALLWPRAPPPVADRLTGNEAPLPDFAPVEVTSSEPGAGLSLAGVVYGATGEPLADAEVFLAASAQSTLVSVKCGVCPELLLACQSHNSWPRVGELLRSGKGHLHAAARTTTGADGRFRFERLHGVSFNVWAASPGHGLAIHERAAPGDPVTLHLPALRGLGGQVSDERGMPVSGARVHVVSRRVPVPRVVTTGPTGVFEAAGLGEGPFYVLVEAEGFLPQAARQVEAGPHPVRVRLRRPRALEVEVFREGERVEATVELTGDHLEHRFTARGGEGRVDALYPEEIQVSAHAGPDSAPVVRVQLQDLVTRVRLDLEPAGRIAVTVVDEAGQPVAEPELWLSRTNDPEPVQRRKARTGELVILGPIAPGSYVVAGAAAGHRRAELPVQVARGAEAQVELVLGRGTFIRGRVLDEYGRPAPRISVLVGPIGQSVWADEEGRFSADVPSPGFYELHAHHSDWGGGDLKVTAPADGVELHLEPRAGLRVTVQSEGRRVEGAEVLLWLDRDTTWRNDRPSGSDGVVLMRGMAPGDYQLVTYHRDYLPTSPKPVSLREGELVDLAVDLEKGAVLEGEVVDQEGAPVVGANIAASPRGTEQVVSDERGQFELRPVWTGRTYRLEAHHPAYDQRDRVTAQAGGPKVTLVLHKRGMYRGRVLTESGEPVKSFRVDAHPVTAVDGRFELPLPADEGRVYAVVEARGYQAHMIDQPADKPDVGDIVLTLEPEVQGFVRDSGGAPVEGALVACDVCDASAMSDAQGAFTLHVPPHLASFTVTARRGSLSGTVTASPKSGERVEVVLRQAVRVRGRVFNAAGQPAAGVELEAVHVDRSEPHTAVTMEDGSYALELAEGSYRFILPRHQRPFGGDAVTFSHVAGADAVVDLGPAPGTASLTVRVAPQNGYALWVVRGAVTQVQNPPLELFKSSWAQMLYQPRTEIVTFAGIPPGRYTVIWSRFHSPGEAPRMQVVDVPGTRELSFAP